LIDIDDIKAALFDLIEFRKAAIPRCATPVRGKGIKPKLVTKPKTVTEKPSE